MPSHLRRLRRRAAAAVAGAALVALAVAPAAVAAEPALGLDTPRITADGSVTITYAAGEAVHAKNWLGVYRDGVRPGGPPSLDWRYVPDASGSVTWGPEHRAGWTRGAASIGPGDYDVYLLADDGYDVLAGPVDLTVEAVRPVEPAEPKPEVDGVSELNVLTFNIWHGGSRIPDGAREIADILRETDADVTFMPERNDTPADVAALLGYDHLLATGTGIVSRYPILETGTVGDRWSKAVLDVNGTEVVAYGGHLEYRWYTTYLPRGYGGAVLGDWPAGWDTWDRLDAPVTDVDAILAANLQSGRPASAAALLEDVRAERAAGRLVVVGGDFNEPSAQDWTEATAELFDHHGVVVPWQTTQTLLDGGLVDAFREVHPDPVANPGFTWPADNAAFPTSELTWAPEADERDRIDYVFVAPDDRVAVRSAQVVGPQSTIVRDERVDDDSADVILTPDAVWPSDHKAVLASLRVCDEACLPSAAPEVGAVVRCLAGTAHVAVRATNTGDTAAVVGLSTAFGERTSADVAPGRHAYQAFSSRVARVDAGAVTVTATVAGRAPVTVHEEYAAKSCG
ncbi:endonuclease/exonuclease/phosphatase family protein [Cellulosimicrobium cellulans]|uniref:Endonuclease/exonuclease/phosphatase domain-containing protein n=1 Tax=Cellulosimicrobium cellulans TaxID=1710 RepID=A0A4Y4DW95_CELCE|nr:endonuclease/exonuclease/phosphatase family protein [Cellulosimicrobium cellulans]GED08993.1 hypothetical protein CCE02nite_09920 [Cellulosimicrobium cellulans]